MCDWFSYAYNESGEFSDAYKTDLSNSGVGVPIGGVLFWVAPTLPSGWLICNGQQVSRTTYASLWALWGEKHGNGNGSTTFNLPNFQGRFLLGAGQRDSSSPNYGFAPTSPLETGGEDAHTLLDTEVPAHTHSIATRKIQPVRLEVNSSTLKLEVNEVYQPASDTPQGDYSAGGATLTTSSKTTGASSGGGAAHNNMPPYSVGYWIVKAL